MSTAIDAGCEKNWSFTLAASLKYLGTAVAARRSTKLDEIETKLTQMRIRLAKVMESPLLTVHKIDAIKTFILPSLDSPLMNGEVGEKQLTNMDGQCVRSWRSV
jgi:hypothetical protein